MNEKKDHPEHVDPLDGIFKELHLGAVVMRGSWLFRRGTEYQRQDSPFNEGVPAGFVDIDTGDWIPCHAITRAKR